MKQQLAEAAWQTHTRTGYLYVGHIKKSPNNADNEDTNRGRPGHGKAGMEVGRTYLSTLVAP